MMMLKTITLGSLAFAANGSSSLPDASLAAPGPEKGHPAALENLVVQLGISVPSKTISPTAAAGSPSEEQKIDEVAPPDDGPRPYEYMWRVRNNYRETRGKRITLPGQKFRRFLKPMLFNVNMFYGENFQPMFIESLDETDNWNLYCGRLTRGNNKNRNDVDIMNKIPTLLRLGNGGSEIFDMDDKWRVDGMLLGPHGRQSIGFEFDDIEGTTFRVNDKRAAESFFGANDDGWSDLAVTGLSVTKEKSHRVSHCHVWLKTIHKQTKKPYYFALDYGTVVQILGFKEDYQIIDTEKTDSPLNQVGGLSWRPVNPESILEDTKLTEYAEKNSMQRFVRWLVGTMNMRKYKKSHNYRKRAHIDRWNCQTFCQEIEKYFGVYEPKSWSNYAWRATKINGYLMPNLVKDPQLIK